MIKNWKKIFLSFVFGLTFLAVWLYAGSRQSEVESAWMSSDVSTVNIVSGSATMAAVDVGERKKPVFAREGALDSAKVATEEEIQLHAEQWAEERAAYEAIQKREKEKKKAEKEAQDLARKREKQKKADAKRPYVMKEVPSDNEVKKYESYTLLTRWHQADLQKIAYTDENGLRKVADRYCVALGSFYTTAIGTEFDLIMENGNVIPCILGDQKSDLHTDAKHQRGNNDGCVAEFIVDVEKLPTTARVRGSVHWIPELAGGIKSIKIYTDKKGF